MYTICNYNKYTYSAGMKERCRDGCRTSLLIAGVVLVPAIFHTLTSTLPSLHHHSFHGNDFFHLYNYIYTYSAEMKERCRDGCRTSLLIAGVVLVPAIFHTSLPPCHPYITIHFMEMIFSTCNIYPSFFKSKIFFIF